MARNADGFRMCLVDFRLIGLFDFLDDMRPYPDAIICYRRKRGCHLQRSNAYLITYRHRCQRIAIPAVWLANDTGRFRRKLDAGRASESELLDRAKEAFFAHTHSGFDCADIA